MSVQHKIFRTANAPRTPPDETEVAVAQAIIDLENRTVIGRIPVGSQPMGLVLLDPDAD